MSNARYIEFDSTYRNRNEWPLPGEFEVMISQSGRKGRMQALDPVSEATNITSWVSNAFDSAGAAPSIIGSVETVTPPISGSGSQQVIVVNFDGNNPQVTQNYYLGAILQANTAPVERRRITSTKFLNQVGPETRLQITTDSPFSSAVVAGTNIIITDPTDLGDVSNPLYFVPDGRLGDNAYANCLLYNETQSLAVGSPVFRNVNGYDFYTHILTVDTTTSVAETNTSGPVASWTVNDTYSIRRATPLLGIANNNVTSNHVISLNTTFSDEQDYFRNSWISMKSGNSNGNTRLITRYETYTANARGGTNTSVIFPSNASTIPGYYNGAYIQILSGAATGDVRLVSNYEVVNGVGTVSVSVPFSGPVATGDSFTFRSLFLSPNFSSTVNNGDDFEILLFSYDNANPFVYTGSQVSQQEMVCYEIELLNLTLPNKTLQSYLGSRIAFYPYIYVELANVSSAGAGIKNSIYSNNPNSTRMVFRAAIDDVPNPTISSFIKVDGDGMVQTLKFKPNDNLRFSVHLSNGSVYETVEKENYGPSLPNVGIQISAVFSIKRLG